MTDLTIVGIDPSLTATGVAFSERNGRAEVTLKTNLRGMARLHYIATEVAAYTEGADLVAIEGYAYGRPNQAAHLGELGGVIRLTLWRAGIRYVDVPPACVKKYATGRGNATKPDVRMAVFKRYGHDIADDNQCDAFVLMAMALHASGHPLEQVPALNRSALDKFEWA